MFCVSDEDCDRQNFVLVESVTFGVHDRSKTILSTINTVCRMISKTVQWYKC